MTQNPVDLLLDSGAVVVRGTGGSRERFGGIRRPAIFRQAATEAIEHFVSASSGRERR